MRRSTSVVVLVLLVCCLASAAHAGRFFATPDLSACWMDVDRHEPVGDETVSTYLISGTLYCISPLAELNGASSISFTELKFTSRLDWEAPK